MSASAEPVPTAESTTRSARLRRPLMIAGVLVVAIGALYVWLTSGRYESTDDAYVQAAHASISSTLPGRIVELAVHDNQHVHRGDLLFRVDEEALRVAVAAAEAKVAMAKLQITAGKAGYQQQLSAAKSAQQTVEFQEKEFARYQKLRTDGVITQSQFDQEQHTLDMARHDLTAAQQQAASVLAALGGSATIDPAEHPAVRQAQAELDRARLTLSYARVYAPDDGIVTRVEQVQLGDFVNSATPLFALISTRNVWIEANFKENQLTHMRPGQTATVKLDSYPGQVFTARVTSISPGTGSQFSMLPAENASGNWVKVVQRLPVRLTLEHVDADLPLHSGLSATVAVDTQTSGDAAPTPRMVRR